MYVATQVQMRLLAFTDKHLNLSVIKVGFHWLQEKKEIRLCKTVLKKQHCSQAVQVFPYTQTWNRCFSVVTTSKFFDMAKTLLYEALEAFLENQHALCYIYECQHILPSYMNAWIVQQIKRIQFCYYGRVHQMVN